MARKKSFQGAGKPVALTTAQTIVFTPQDLESSGLIALLFSWNGAGNTNSDIDRIRVRAGGDILVDCTWLELQAYQQRWSKRNVANLDAGTSFQVPLNFLDAPTMDARDRCQYPPNREIQVEIVTLATTVAGFLVAGWVQTDQPADFYMKYYDSQLNIPASTSNAKYPFSEAGVIRGLTIPTAGIARAELFLSERSAFRLPGPQFGGSTYGDLISEADYLEDGITVTTARCHSVDLNIPAAPGSSYLLLDTGAGWAGVTNTGAFYSVVPLARGA